MAIASVIDTLAEDGEEFGLDFDVYWELMYPVLPLYEIKYQPFDKLRVETVAPLSLLVHQLSELLQYYSYYKDHSVLADRTKTRQF